FVDDQAAARAADAVEHHVLVPRVQRPEVYHVGAEALGGRLAAWHHRAPGDDRDLLAFARLFRAAEWQDVLVARPRPPRPAVVEHRAMLEEQYRIVAAKAESQQADRILGVRRHRDLPARVVDELDLVGHRMPRVAAFEEAAWHAQHHRRGEAVVGAPAHRAAV